MAVELIDMFKPLEPWFVKHRRDCWLPIVEDGDGGSTDSKFSGSPWLAEGEEWPACAGCRGPMVLFLQLDLATVPVPIRDRIGIGLLQAFFCLEADCVYGPEEAEPFTGTHLLRVVDPAGAPGASRSSPPGISTDIPVRRIVGWERVDDYPSMAEAEELGLDMVYGKPDDHIVCKELAFSVVGNLEEYFTMPWARDNEKLGGWPCWANVCTVYPECPECGRRMDFMIFQFGYEGHIPIMFGDGGQGHIVCCPEHPRVLAYPWSCG